MNIQNAKSLNELSQAFYAQRAQEFSDTRQAGWPGWERCWESIGRTKPREILDVACGNLRFESWLQAKGNTSVLHFTCIDSCKALLPNEIPNDISFINRDIVGSLLENPPSKPFLSQPFDAAVCFGFMHHVPGNEARTKLLDSLLSSVKIEGTVALSFWRFADVEAMRDKAINTTQLALKNNSELSLDPGDYLLGFNDKTETFRYCHSFNSEEIDSLVASASLPCHILDRWRSDGRTSALNEYVLLMRD